MDTKTKIAKEYTPKNYLSSFVHAIRGISIILRTERNARVHITILLVVLVFGIFFNISLSEWIFIIFATGMVFCAEAFNTAVELSIDLTSPDFHPRARDAKDVAAGAVLFASITAFLIGFSIFFPRIIFLVHS